MTACFQSLGEKHFDPLVRASFMLSGGLIVGGTQRLLRLRT